MWKISQNALQDLKSNQSRLRVRNIPHGINFKYPLNYGLKNLCKIIEATHDLLFVFDEANMPSTSSVVVVPGVTYCHRLPYIID